MIDFSKLASAADARRACLYMSENERPDCETLGYFAYLCVHAAGIVRDPGAVSNSLSRHALAWVADVDEKELRKYNVEVVWLADGEPLPEPRFDQGSGFIDRHEEARRLRLDLSRVGRANAPGARLYMPEADRADCQTLGQFAFSCFLAAGLVGDARAVRGALSRHVLAFAAQVDEKELHKHNVEVVWLADGGPLPEPRFEPRASRLVVVPG